MATPEEAQRLGIIDELSTKDALLETAEKRMQGFLQLPDVGRVLTKNLLREEFSRAWEAYAEEEARMGFAALSSPKMVKALGGALVKLGFDKSKL
jgi:enoyl-CoA hydratase/carnithine racemase